MRHEPPASISHGVSCYHVANQELKKTQKMIRIKRNGLIEVVSRGRRKDRPRKLREELTKA